MTKTLLGACGVLLTIGTAWVVAQEKVPTGDAKQGAGQAAAKATAQAATTEQKYSYAVGHDLGLSFRSREVALNTESLIAGLEAGLSGADPKFDRETCFQALRQLQKIMSDKEQAAANAASAGNRKLGEAFLAANRKKEGVQVTASGLQYKVLVAGDGAKPGSRDKVRCNYRGTLIDGREFDAGKNFEFNVAGGVIKGWLEAATLMRVGDKWELYVPAELAYGNDAAGPMITPGSTLIFEIEMTGIVGK